MRIISQDGMIDVTYNLGNLSIGVGRCDDVERASIYFHSCSCNATKLAEYKSVVKAKRAMEMLREEYLKHLFSRGGAMATADFYVPAFAFIPPKVFQFPADEDLED